MKLPKKKETYYIPATKIPKGKQKKFCCHYFPQIHKYHCFNSNHKTQGIIDSGGDWLLWIFFPHPSWIYGLKSSLHHHCCWWTYCSSQSSRYNSHRMDSARYLTPLPFFLIHSKSWKAFLPCTGEPSLWLYVCSVWLLLLKQVILKAQENIHCRHLKKDTSSWWRVLWALVMQY